MATVTEYAGAASGTSWTNPTNANADDAAYATYTIAAKNTTGNEATLSSFGFDSSIPAGAAITSVALVVEHKVSTNSGIAFLESAVRTGGVTGTFNSASDEPTTDTQVTYSSVAKPGGGAWTRNDLLDATFEVRLRARTGNSATSVIHSWDYARVVVVYTETHDLTAEDIATPAPTLTVATVGQKHVLLADDVATPAPILSTPVLAEVDDGVDDLTANDIAAGAPTATAAALGQKHALTADDVAAGTPTATVATLGQVHVLTADDILAGAPTATLATLGQVHVLAANDIASGAPTLGTPALAEESGERILLADDILWALPLLSRPGLFVFQDKTTIPAPLARVGNRHPLTWGRQFRTRFRDVPH